MRKLVRWNKENVKTIRLDNSDLYKLEKVMIYLQMNFADLLRMYIRKNNNYYLGLMLNKHEMNVNKDFENREPVEEQSGYENQVYKK
jgi:hypothetical protein